MLTASCSRSWFLVPLAMLTGCSWIGGKVDGTFRLTLPDHSHQVTLVESRISYRVFTKLRLTLHWDIPENQDTPLANVSPP